MTFKTQAVLTSKPVRIVACVDEPLANECFDHYPWNCRFPGIEIEAIYTILNGMLKLPIEWVKVDNYSAVEHAMDTDKADMLGVSEVLMPYYATKWGYTHSFMYDRLALISKISYANNSQPFSLMDDFTLDLWLAITAFSIAMLAIHWLSHCMKKRLETDTKIKWPLKFFLLYVTFVFRTRICYAVWFVLLSVILNFYSNLIVVDIVAPTQTKMAPFSSLQDLGEKLMTKQCRLILSETYKDSSVEFNSAIINPEIGLNNKTWVSLFARAYLENPPMVVDDREVMLDYIVNSTCIVGVDYESMNAYFTTRYCDISIISYPEDIPQHGYTFYNMRKDVDEALAAVISSDSVQSISEYLSIKYYSNPNPPDCASSIYNIISAPIIDFNKIQDSFYILFIGIALAVLVGLISYIHKAFKLMKFKVWKPEAEARVIHNYDRCSSHIINIKYLIDGI